MLLLFFYLFFLVSILLFARLFDFVVNSCLFSSFAARLPTSMSSHSGTEFGRITFEFEIVCVADCEFYFMMVRQRLTDVCRYKCIFTLWGENYSKYSGNDCSSGCKQEEYYGGGVVGGNENETDVHTRHDPECLGVLHVGFPEDKPTFRCKYESTAQSIY